MIRLMENGVYLLNGQEILSEEEYRQQQNQGRPECQADLRQAIQSTISYPILQSHNSGTEEELKLKFDALTSHDMTNVGIIQTARACGLKEFPMPVVLTNCQNTLCAIGGTINRDDHIFALNAAQKYGGICVPVNTAVIHTYMREMMAGCGQMIMGADSHTRYGALGTMGVGEGGGELVKQLLGQSYDLKRPNIAAVYLTGRLRPGVERGQVVHGQKVARFRKLHVPEKGFAGGRGGRVEREVKVHGGVIVRILDAQLQILVKGLLSLDVGRFEQGQILLKALRRRKGEVMPADAEQRGGLHAVRRYRPRGQVLAILPC